MGLFGSGRGQHQASKQRQAAFRSGKRSSAKAAREYAETQRRKADFAARKAAAKKQGR